MPPKQSTEGSKFLVPKGSKSGKQKEEQSKALVFHGAKNSERHSSTSRALVLRKAAYGTGEVVVSGKISGQEKLFLLADEMMTSAVRSLFNMDQLLKMAESQLGMYLDDISGLKDPESFYDDILATIDSRPESRPDRNGTRKPPIHDPKWVALAVGCRVHNAYLLAGSWRIVRNILKELEAMGLGHSDVRGQLRANEKLRARYLILYDMVTTLARMGQQRVSNVAAGTAHYAPYFVRRNKVGQDGEMEFDFQGNNLRKIREAHRSFIDAILLELILPDSQYPPYVLMALLHNAVEECRKEEKRFSQALWDSVGDFSVTVQVLDFIEGPLLGPEGEEWVRNTSLSKEYNEFLEVQALSDKACQHVESWKSCLRPLIGTRKKSVLDQLWYNINKSCQQVSGLSIDHLWSLQYDLQRSPQWSTYFIPYSDSDSDPGKKAVVLHKGVKRPGEGGSGKRRLEIGGNSDDDMPPLMTVSDSSDDDDPISDSSDNEELSEGDSESDYSPEEDELLQEMLREALDAVIDMDLPEHPDFDLRSEDKKSGNPFTRMLATFKDRYFSANPTLRANERSRNPFKPRQGAALPPESAINKPKKDSDDDIPPLEPIRSAKVKPKSSQVKSTVQHAPTSEEELPPLIPIGASFPLKKPKATIQEVSDEDEDIQSKKKKKKKKKKTKKPQETPAPPQAASGAQKFPPPGTPPSTPSKVPKEGSIKQSSRQTSIHSSMDGLGTNFSRTSLLSTHETAAQSGRAYMQSEKLTTEKTKVKTRPAFAASFFKPRKSISKPTDGHGERKIGFLGHMKKRTSNLLCELISPADGKSQGKKPMKWEKFLTVMRDMGFSYDPSTAGSSVRFDPPDPKDLSITFHKPHPDPTLHRHHQRTFGYRLRKTYGWNPEQFNNFGVGELDEEDSD
ncbi:hypothetical protein K439DRAFT_1621649 [Ramaria rubella]|nr:hypothetical protein K439DRAFT_1621649 [Ramaria rubella]